MAIFKGRDDLIKSLQEAKRNQDKKGLEAEIKVGDILKKYLPENTYIIAQPDIGELHPDFLIINPHYGFRIVEVKNININNIEGILSNGVLQTRFGNRNPLAQVKSHVDGLKNYLISNHPNLGLGDPYKSIGYCVIHLGFSKRSFEYKFANQLNKWSSEDKRDYFKYHLFSEQLDSGIVNAIERATKFQVKGYSLTDNAQMEIVESIKVSHIKMDEDGYFERFNDHEEKIALVNAELNQIKKNMQSYQINSKQEEMIVGKKRNKFIFLIYPIIIALFIIGFTVFKALDADEIGTEKVLSSFESLDDRTEGYIEVKAKVTRFYYDSNSDTKFLTLSDGELEIEAVIFKNTKVPFIEEGETYIFEGNIQPSKNQKGNEIKITGIQ
ncbi:NERD domain-containing protein [Neobacillus sp. D3-1R]|uniref:NERD domain-containing protein n=1 Tax=Neobacillus sp. D3-1R TaxID=3445778 RepID=UPI003F9F42C5